MYSCDPGKCPEKEYIHNCVKCYPVAAVCETCQARLHYPVGDPERGDRFIRGAPIGSWMCPICGAMELDVDERADKTIQTTLEGFYD
ncbi:hypothetical protein FGU46_03195 [Methanobacterium sp. CWC-01]|uniref:hypothetical protein n=1 Tax=Methanobacterium aridiramus TaxID=2584467 RepID=UPI002578F95C|nr:hypothetical protein [Methanobacterium sp. CWC-01]WJI09165.1 hypothetical protein FGU46_03195 [Methanobacterium sp. CWC-01]